MSKINRNSDDFKNIYQHILQSLKPIDSKNNEEIVHHLTEIYEELADFVGAFNDLSKSPNISAIKKIDACLAHWHYHLSCLRKCKFGDYSVTDEETPIKQYDINGQ